MPAQPPFLTPTRTAAIGRSVFAITALMRSAAASVRRITWGLGRGAAMSRLLVRDVIACLIYVVAYQSATQGTSPHIQHRARLVRHAARVPRRIPDDVDLGLAHASDTGDRIFDLARQLGRRRTVRRGQCHIDMHGAIIVDVDFVDQPELVNVGRNFRIVDRLDRGNDVIGQPRHLIRRNVGRPLACVHSDGRSAFRRGLVGVVNHVKKSRAFNSACASTSTSSRVLYMANEARQVAVTPNRANSGMTQWVPARTATPARSITVATSCGWAPFISNDTIGPLPLAVPKMRSALISRSRSCA